MVRTKVFVGNLSFKTREAELAQEFVNVGAKVVGANIITRGPRSLGYGFVELESEEDAHKAVSAMDKKEIDGRPINVEVAKERVETEKDKTAPAADKTATSPATGEKKTGGRGGAKAARGGRGGAKTGAKRTPKAKEGTDAKPATDKAATPAPAAAPKAPRVKKERPPRDTESRNPSATSLFVANLPFSLTDESFGKIFTDAGFKFKKAHVVVKKNAKSKGFGFVEFDSQEDQQKALTALTGHKVEDRELIFRVALEESPAALEAAANAAANASSPAPASTASPATPAAKDSPKPAAATPTTPKA